MPRSSESVAALAAALAKAQAELVNPEKTQLATVRADRPGETNQTFRYAPLSSGLDIVRKTLSRHEIATIQTTAIDQPAGVVNLTTMLAHASGEWIASDWPVCKIADMTSPRWMGAALTYARRYALFTLVGIAGEDDLDAPDLGSTREADTGPISRAGNGDRKQDGLPGRTARARVPTPVLAATESAALRDRFVAELQGLETPDAAALWAKRVLPAKGTLTDADARVVEKEFQAKISGLHNVEPAGNAVLVKQGATQPQPGLLSNASAEGARTSHSARPKITERRRKGVAAKPIRLRDKEHRKTVSRQPCVVCGRTPSDPHHLRFVQPRALGRKVSDEFTVPLCRLHHRALHRHGDEAAWWRSVAIDPVPIALKLWQATQAADANRVETAAGQLGRSQPDPKADSSPP